MLGNAQANANEGIALFNSRQGLGRFFLLVFVVLMGLGKHHPALCGDGFTLGDEQGGLCFAEWHGDIAFQADLGDIEWGAPGCSDRGAKPDFIKFVRRKCVYKFHKCFLSSDQLGEWGRWASIDGHGHRFADILEHTFGRFGEFPVDNYRICDSKSYILLKFGGNRFYGRSHGDLDGHWKQIRKQLFVDHERHSDSVLWRRWVSFKYSIWRIYPTFGEPGRLELGHDHEPCFDLLGRYGRHDLERVQHDPVL